MRLFSFNKKAKKYNSVKSLFVYVVIVNEYSKKLISINFLLKLKFKPTSFYQEGLFI